LTHNLNTIVPYTFEQMLEWLSNQTWFAQVGEIIFWLVASLVFLVLWVILVCIYALLKKLFLWLPPKEKELRTEEELDEYYGVHRKGNCRNYGSDKH
jgi:hypothetical protein